MEHTRIVPPIDPALRQRLAQEYGRGWNDGHLAAQAAAEQDKRHRVLTEAIPIWALFVWNRISTVFGQRQSFSLHQNALMYMHRFIIITNGTKSNHIYRTAFSILNDRELKMRITTVFVRLIQDFDPAYDLAKIKKGFSEATSKWTADWKKVVLREEQPRHILENNRTTNFFLNGALDLQNPAGFEFEDQGESNRLWKRYVSENLLFCTFWEGPRFAVNIEECQNWNCTGNVWGLGRRGGGVTVEFWGAILGDQKLLHEINEQGDQKLLHEIDEQTRKVRLHQQEQFVEADRGMRKDNNAGGSDVRMTPGPRAKGVMRNEEEEPESDVGESGQESYAEKQDIRMTPDGNKAESYSETVQRRGNEEEGAGVSPFDVEEEGTDGEKVPE